MPLPDLLRVRASQPHSGHAAQWSTPEPILLWWIWNCDQLRTRRPLSSRPGLLHLSSCQCRQLISGSGGTSSTRKVQEQVKHTNCKAHEEEPPDAPGCFHLSIHQIRIIWRSTHSVATRRPIQWRWRWHNRLVNWVRYGLVKLHATSENVPDLRRTRQYIQVNPAKRAPDSTRLETQDTTLHMEYMLATRDLQSVTRRQLCTSKFAP